MKPRFQFRLRTLFVVVTLFSIPCGYVGWQAKIVRERKEMQRDWEKHGAMFLFSSLDPPSFMRRLFGDMSAFVVWIPACDDREKGEIEKVFPEASVEVGGSPPIVD